MTSIVRSASVVKACRLQFGRLSEFRGAFAAAASVPAGCDGWLLASNVARTW